MKINTNTALQIKQGINEMNSRYLSGKEILIIRKIQKELDEKINTSVAAQKKLFRDYDIKPTKNGYNWSQHEKADEITQKHKEISTLKVKTNCLPEEVVASAASVIGNLQTVNLLIDHLGKKK